MSTHVVVGATGGTGSALVHELLDRGEKVRAVSRKGDCAIPGVEAIAADASDAPRMREVCAGATAVCNCVNPPFDQWRAVYPEAIRALVAAAGATNAVLAFADDTWMYGRVDGPMTEETPARPVTELGVFRAWLAEMTLAAHYRGDAQVVIARAGELYGPNVESVLGQNLFGRAVVGRRPIWFGNPDLPLTPTYIGDFARGLATVAADPQVWGRVWHVPHAAPTTGRELIGRLGQRLGRQIKPLVVSAAMTKPLKAVSPVVRIGASLLYQFEQPFVVDSSKYLTAYHDQPTSYVDGIDRTIKWYQENRDLIRPSALPR